MEEGTLSCVYIVPLPQMLRRSLGEGLGVGAVYSESSEFFVNHPRAESPLSNVYYLIPIHRRLSTILLIAIRRSETCSVFTFISLPALHTILSLPFSLTSSSASALHLSDLLLRNHIF